MSLFLYYIFVFNVIKCCAFIWKWDLCVVSVVFLQQLNIRKALCCHLVVRFITAWTQLSEFYCRLSFRQYRLSRPRQELMRKKEEERDEQQHLLMAGLHRLVLFLFFSTFKGYFGNSDPWIGFPPEDAYCTGLYSSA